MSTIQVRNLEPKGLELFNSAESFINELSDEDLQISSPHGGCTPFVLGLWIGACISGATKQ
jgi:hypothetical protein